jgi:hypothetical protein
LSRTVTQLRNTGAGVAGQPEAVFPELPWLGLSFHWQVRVASNLGGVSMATGRFPRERLGNASGESYNLFLAPALAWSAWNPFLAAALKGNALAKDGFATIASEWQGFVALRLQEDIALMQRLTRCGTSDQLLGAYTDFWHKAGEDYGKEITTMTKLMTGVTSKMVVAAQSATEQVSTAQFPWQRAA